MTWKLKPDDNIIHTVLQSRNAVGTYLKKQAVAVFFTLQSSDVACGVWEYSSKGTMVHH